MSSSQAPTKSDTTSPYGTRSRNRAARPNYAEDKDSESDILELEPRKKLSATKKATRQSGGANGSTSRLALSCEVVVEAGSQPSIAQLDTPDADAGRVSNRKRGLSDVQAEDTPASGGSKATVASSNNQNASAASSLRKRKASSSVPAGSSSGRANVSAQSLALAVSAGSDRQKAALGHTNMLLFEESGAFLKNGCLVADDGTTLQVNDHVYLVCEPPAEPYYLARIMEFMHVSNDPTRAVDALRVNWFYRPRDIGRKPQGTRLLYASMHSDTCPLTSLRGKCQITHRAEISNMDAFRKSPDCFWFEKLYDRYIQKNYEVIPTTQVVNVPAKVKKVLDNTWRYILVEQGRGKELTSAVKTCRKCREYCASNDSVDCAVCQQTYHMNCVNPPLLKKPSRGFAWSCGPCSRAQERKLEALNTPAPSFRRDVKNGTAAGASERAEDEEDENEEDENEDEEEAEEVEGGDMEGKEVEGPHSTQSEHATTKAASSPAAEIVFDDSVHAGTQQQKYQASLWPYRYLGMHCKPEDVLDYDDRIYPRASSRLGPKHQATVLPWCGRPVQYVKPLEMVKRTGREKRLSKEAQAALDEAKKLREQRPKWIQDEPLGYLRRGEDLPPDDPNNTCSLIWKPPEELGHAMTSQELDEYFNKARKVASARDISSASTNLLDVARDILFQNNFNEEVALEQLASVDRMVFDEPLLTTAEHKKFEEGVSKHGSELHLVTKHVGTLSPATVVRYYYVWKKTPRGKALWGNYRGRKHKKDPNGSEQAASKLEDDVADDADDSAFDMQKASTKKRAFICKFCSVRSSPQWRRAPNGFADAVVKGKDKNGQYIQALCHRCAELWRRYAVQWEAVEDFAKKMAQAGNSKTWKRKMDEEILSEIRAGNEISARAQLAASGSAACDSNEPATSAMGSGSGDGGSGDLNTTEGTTVGVCGPLQKASVTSPCDPPRKRFKSSGQGKNLDSASGGAAITATAANVTAAGVVLDKDRARVNANDAVTSVSPVADLPTPLVLPCAVCRRLEPLGDQQVSCRECRLSVHRNCYGVSENRIAGKWTCDMCLNDKNPQVAVRYRCVLCPVDRPEHAIAVPAKALQKKKTTEKQRERLERLEAARLADEERSLQLQLNRPADPRQALKRTADNNWVHVTCALWTPEVKFANAKALEPCEGIPSIPRARYGEICKACNQQGGACVYCSSCRAPVHVECAHRGSFLLAFDVSPIKGSRRDSLNAVSLNGETGILNAVIWCKEHVPNKVILHHMHEAVDDSGLNVLQLYAQAFKQADLTLTGTARRALLLSLASKSPLMAAHSVCVGTGRRSLPSISPSTVSASHSKSTPLASSPMSCLDNKVCRTCGTSTSPKWWAPPEETFSETLTQEARKFAAQRSFRCHKCHKARRSACQPEKLAVARKIDGGVVEPVASACVTPPRPRHHSPRLPQVDSSFGVGIAPFPALPKSPWIGPAVSHGNSLPSVSTSLPTAPKSIVHSAYSSGATHMQPSLLAHNRGGDNAIPPGPQHKPPHTDPLPPSRIIPRTDSQGPVLSETGQVSASRPATALPPYFGSAFDDWSPSSSHHHSLANANTHLISEKRHPHTASHHAHTMTHRLPLSKPSPAISATSLTGPTPTSLSFATAPPYPASATVHRGSYSLPPLSAVPPPSSSTHSIYLPPISPGPQDSHHTAPFKSTSPRRSETATNHVYPHAIIQQQGLQSVMTPGGSSMPPPERSKMQSRYQHETPQLPDKPPPPSDKRSSGGASSNPALHNLLS